MGSEGNNLCVVLHGKGDLRFEKRSIPIANPDQLLIKVDTVGICGSDVHYWTHGSIGRYVVRKPMVLGHETSGHVVALGSNVLGFDVGDRVTIEPGLPCRRCDYCKMGRYNLCPRMQFHATPPVDGSLAQYVVHDADFCYKLPNNVTMAEGSMIEPLSVAIHACRRANISFGQNVLITGAGPIGLLCLLTARMFGAQNVVITDLIDDRLDLALELGARAALNVRGKEPAQIAEAVCSVFDQQMADVAIDCAGVASSIHVAILTVKSGGTVVMVGLGDDQPPIPLVEATTREIDIRGVFRYANCYPTAIQMLTTGALMLNKLSVAHYQFSDTETAFKRCLLGDVAKVFIHCQNLSDTDGQR